MSLKLLCFRYMILDSDSVIHFDFYLLSHHENNENKKSLSILYYYVFVRYIGDSTRLESFQFVV